ncbi:hypothetical protein GCM10010946_16660 [Undibacterium squillarum]|uniref:Uncharacterized protein n=1 Tax=Undibacterium squillarum TaxID=1131567 RepID=A0ABQ2XXY7_9BURK|nr:hypothetical protein GCM10010946_16660 [Undibacterium squillarum]
MAGEVGKGLPCKSTSSLISSVTGGLPALAGALYKPVTAEKAAMPVATAIPERNTSRTARHKDFVRVLSPGLLQGADLNFRMR